MKNTQRATVVGVFTDRHQADQAVSDLRRAGFRDDQIGVAGRNSDDTHGTTAGEKGSHAGAGATTGVVAGAAAGGLVGLGILAGIIPVIGPVIAGGALAVILANAAGGAAIAGLVGALVGLGIPEEEAHYYEGEFKAGRIVVTVKAEGRSDEAWAILQRHGAYDRSTAATATATATPVRAATATAASTGGQTLRVHEEEMHARKQPVQTGEVRVHKEVITEHKTLEVPVQREEVVIERHPVAGGRASASDIRAGEEIRIPVKEEQVHIEKTPVVKEEVTVGKHKVQETKQVSGTVRKEQVRVEREGNVDVRGNTDVNDKGGGKR